MNGRIAGLAAGQRVVAVLLWFVTGFAIRAAADPVHYNEAVSGDLGSVSPFTLLVLDIGTNTVSGTEHYFTVSMPPDVDADSFAVAVPAGAALASITYATTLTSGTSGQVTYWLSSGNGAIPQLANQTIELGTLSPFGMFATALPLGTGIYSLFNFSLSSGPNLAPWTDAYTWTLDVASTASPTPEPASLLLFGSSLAGMLLRFRMGR